NYISLIENNIPVPVRYMGASESSSLACSPTKLTNSHQAGYGSSVSGGRTGVDEDKRSDT
ncbi:MAG: hypothetical protein K0R55_4571, partial [Sporomusa sp.]|nr:hypothetical protein [Sporomusa sp.]